MPTWDLEKYFPSLDSPEFVSAKRELEANIENLGRLLASLEPEADALEGFLRAWGSVVEDYYLIESYIYGKLTTNTRDDLAQARASEIESTALPLRNLRTRFEAWIGGQDLDRLIGGNAYLREHEYLLRRAQTKALHQMSRSEEELAAELALSGSSAWARLHGTVSSQLEVPIDLGDGSTTMPMSAVRNLAYDANRDRRRIAYHAELSAWKAVEVPLAAAMNGVKGAVAVLARRRKWPTGLDEAVFENAIDRETLEAMMGAAQEAFPDFHRYLRAKARALGLEQLEWYDLFAPLEGDARRWSVDEACEFVAVQFGRYSQKMGDFARLSFRDRWTDFEPRAGKVDGAYCMGTLPGESRILMNFKPSFGSVKTLAHELGHAYHNLCLAPRTPLNRETPSTLAETASIFCETVVKHAALAEAAGAEKVALLEACLMGPCQTIVDITSRFLFEQAVFEGRANRDQSPDELSAFMLEAQKATYGDALCSYHPYMWAAKPHYYSEGSFYNFPYMFGLLFSLGLYAQFEADPDGFRGRYDDLLGSTGMADAWTLGQRFGFDTRDAAFWRASLDVLRADIAEFDRLV